MQISFPQKSKFGTVTATKLICPEIDTAAGDLVLKSAGVSAQTIATNSSYFHDHIRLANNKELRDAVGNVIIAGDNSGHIDQLGRIDAAVTSPTASHTIYLSAGEIVSLGQHALINETVGSWVAVGNDDFYGWLNTAIHRLALKGTVHIETIKVFLATGHANDYASNLRLHRRALTDAARVAVANNPGNFGAGTTGNAIAEVTANHEVLADSVYSIQLSAIVPNTSVTIYGLEILYHMV